MAQCVDIRRERFSREDRLLLDTNVALDLATPLAAVRDEQRAYDYSTSISRALNAGAAISVSVLSFFEIANFIERQAYRSRHGAWPQGAELKSFRRDSKERSGVVEGVRATWAELTAFATILDARIGRDLPLDVLRAAHSALLDGYDPLIVDAARTSRATLVTHDADFATVDNLIVMTVNARMLATS